MNRKYTAWIILSSLAVSFFFPSCYYDKEELLTKLDVCDTTAVLFSTDITAVLNESCLSCHTQANASGGVSLETYSDVKAQADNGKLLGTVTHANGFTAMPQGAPKLESCKIDKISAWIHQGAQNN